MSHAKQQAARAFAFGGAALLIGVVVFFFTQGLIPLVELQDIAGSVFTAGFILIFLNLSYGMSRRFCSRTFELERFPYILGLVLILPTMVLSIVTDRFTSITAMIIFYGLITTASFAGVFFGSKSGRRKRDQYVKKVLESGGSNE